MVEVRMVDRDEKQVRLRITGASEQAMRDWAGVLGQTLVISWSAPKGCPTPKDGG